MIRLSISEEGQPPRLVTFNKDVIVVGRDASCDLQLVGKGMSSHHCRVMQTPGGLRVEDLGSTNGTYVNRTRISSPVLVSGNDEIVLAVYQVRVIDENGARPPVPTYSGAQPAMPSSTPGIMSSGAIPVTGPGVLPTTPLPPPTGAYNHASSGTPPMTGAPPMTTGSAASLGTSTTGSHPTGVAFDDAKWVREWERLDKLAAEWLNSKRDRTRLLRGDKLAHARRWLEQGRGRQPKPKREHLDFIQSSANAARLRVARNVTAGGMIVGLVGVAAWQLMPTDDAPIVADARATDTPGDDPKDAPPVEPKDVPKPVAVDGLADKARALVDGEPDLAALLALVALANVDTTADVRGTAAERVLRTALATHRGQPLRGHDGPITLASMSGDGRWVASVADGSDATVAFLWDVSRPGVATSHKLRGQTGTIRSAAFSPDGKTLVTGTDSDEIWRWDLEQTPPAPRTIAAPEGGIVAMQWSRDGKWLVAGGRSGRARVIDMSNPTAAPTVLEGHTGSISAVDVDTAGTRIATASQDGTARIWRLAAGALAGKTTVLEGHMGTVADVALSNDGVWALTGGADSLGKLWDLRGRPAARDFTHQAAVDHVAFSPDSRVALTASADGIVTVWKLTVAQPELAGLADRRGSGKGSISALAVRGPAPGSKDGARTWAIATSIDGSMRTLDPTQIDKTIEGQVIAAHGAGAVPLGVDAKAKFAVTGGGDGVARVWDLAERGPGGPTKIGRGHPGKVVDVAINAAGTRALSGGADGDARLWAIGDAPRLREIAVMPVHKGGVAVAIGPDGRYGATSSEDGIVRLWPADGDGPELAHKDYPGHEAEVNDVVFGPDGRVLVSVSNDKTARVWRMTDDPARDVVVLKHPDVVTHAAIGPASKWLVTATISGITLWNLDGKDPASASLPLAGHDSDVLSIAISHDGKWAASGDANDRVVLWELGAEVKGRRLKQHGDRVEALAFSPDGRWLASAGKDRQVVVWRISSKHPEDDPIVLTGHEATVGELAWSTDGKWLYSGDNGGIVRAWPIERPNPIEEAMVLAGHTDLVSGIAVVTDGSAIATTSYDGAVRLWPLHPEGLRDVACGLVGRDLTADEWAQHIGGAAKPVCE